MFDMDINDDFVVKIFDKEQTAIPVQMFIKDKEYEIKNKQERWIATVLSRDEIKLLCTYLNNVLNKD